MALIHVSATVCNVDEKGQVIERLAVAPIFTRHAGRQVGYGKAQMPQQGCKRCIQLVAEPATAVDDDLFKESRLSKADGSPQMNIEVLKGHGQQVASMQGSQGVKAWRNRTIIFDPFKVSLDIHGGSVPLPRVTDVLKGLPLHVPLQVLAKDSHHPVPDVGG